MKSGASFQIQKILAFLQKLKHCGGNFGPLWILVGVPLAQQGPELLRSLFLR